MARLIFILLLLLPVTVSAQGVEIEQGQPAPAQGALFADGGLIKLTEALRDLDSLQQQVAALRAELKAKDDQIASQKEGIADLEESRKETANALAKAEVILENWKLIYDSMRDLIKEHQQLASDYKTLNEQMAKQLKATNTELRWTKILSAVPIIGLLLAVF